MKRIVIVCVFLVLIAATCGLSMYRVDTVKNEVLAQLEDIQLAHRNGHQTLLEQRAGELQEYWEDTEHMLGHYVRHSQLDDITKSIARLKALARYGDDAQLHAELDSIRHQILHVWESERPLWGNIL